MSLPAIKVVARTPTKGRRVLTRSRTAKTKSSGPCRFNSGSVCDAVGAMVLSSVLCSTPVPNPCLLETQLVEALFLCSNQILKGSADDCPGQLSISLCGAVSVH